MKKYIYLQIILLITCLFLMNGCVRSQYNTQIEKSPISSSNSDDEKKIDTIAELDEAESQYTDGKLSYDEYFKLLEEAKTSDYVKVASYAESLLEKLDDISIDESTIETTEEKIYETTEDKTEEEINANVSYQTHIENIGWIDTVSNGATSGTMGESKRMEGLKISLTDMTGISGYVEYCSHVQNIGWMDWAKDGEQSGVTGESKGIEAVQIKLSGDISNYYDVYYRVHVQNMGWLGWAKNGENAGTTGYSYHVEAIQIQLIKIGETVPQSSVEAFKERHISANISYQTHIENIGWIDMVSNGATSGTMGESKRMEGLKVSLTDMTDITGSVEYCAHVQNVGWMSWVKDGALSGVTGESKGIEAVQIKLSGDISNYYDVYYRVHVQNMGWLGWAKNGESAGTTGYSYHVEAIQIQLVKIGETSPESSVEAFKERHISANISYRTHIENKGWIDTVSNGATSGTMGESKRMEGLKVSLTNMTDITGSVEYCAHVQNVGWMDWVKDGAVSGVTGESKGIEAVQIKLSGDISNYYDVYYRVHVQNMGWLGWAKNGESAGTTGYSYHVEAIQIQLIKKGEAAPENSTEAFKKNEETVTAAENSFSKETELTYEIDDIANKKVTYNDIKGVFENASDSVLEDGGYCEYALWSEDLLLEADETDKSFVIFLMDVVNNQHFSLMGISCGDSWSKTSDAIADYGEYYLEVYLNSKGWDYGWYNSTYGVHYDTVYSGKIVDWNGNLFWVDYYVADDVVVGLSTTNLSNYPAFNYLTD